MKKEISILDEKLLEEFMSIFSIGLIECLQNELIDTNRAEQWMFSFVLAYSLKKKDFSKKFINAMKHASEIDAMKNAEYYSKNIQEIKELFIESLRSYKKLQVPNDRVFFDGLITLPLDCNENKIFTNGYIIQTQEDSMVCSKKEYKGISSKISWPLDSKCDELQKNLETQWIDNYLNQEPVKRMYEFIFDTTLLSRYMQKCAEKKIITRTLYLETVETDQHFSQKDCEGQLLGYELIYPSGNYYSALSEEWEMIPKAGLITNEWGLFNDEASLDKFIIWRKAQPIMSEPLQEFVKAKVYLVSNYKGQ